MIPFRDKSVTPLKLLKKPMDSNSRKRVASVLLGLMVFSGLIVVLITIDEVSITLMSLGFGAYFTLPWAFGKEINKSVEKREKELKKKGVDEDEAEGLSRQPQKWLSQSRHAFLFSGFFLLFQLILEASSSTPVFPFTSLELSGFANLLLVVGLMSSIVGFVQGYHTVEYWISSSYTPKFQLSWLVIIGGIGMIQYGYLSILASLFPYLGSFRQFALISQVFTISLFLSFVGAVAGVLGTILSKRKTFLLGMALLVFPVAAIIVSGFIQYLQGRI
jgi:cation transport ATPase